MRAAVADGETRRHDARGEEEEEEGRASSSSLWGYSYEVVDEDVDYENNLLSNILRRRPNDVAAAAGATRRSQSENAINSSKLTSPNNPFSAPKLQFRANEVTAETVVADDTTDTTTQNNPFSVPNLEVRTNDVTPVADDEDGTTTNNPFSIPNLEFRTNNVTASAAEEDLSLIHI